jgi:hypothetical protein
VREPHPPSHLARLALVSCLSRCCCASAPLNGSGTGWARRACSLAAVCSDRARLVAPTLSSCPHTPLVSCDPAARNSHSPDQRVAVIMVEATCAGTHPSPPCWVGFNARCGIFVSVRLTCSGGGGQVRAKRELAESVKQRRSADGLTTDENPKSWQKVSLSAFFVRALSLSLSPPLPASRPLPTRKRRNAALTARSESKNRFSWTLPERWTVVELPWLRTAARAQ